MEDFQQKFRRGIGSLVFGMTETEVVSLLGDPSILTDDPDDDEVSSILKYDHLKLTLSFYSNARLAYIRSSNPALGASGRRIIGEQISKVLRYPDFAPLDWDLDAYFLFDTYTNIDNWIVLKVEYNRVARLEMGVPPLEHGGYDWPVR